MAAADQANDLMNIGEVAKRMGIRSSAVRYYERIGLIPQQERVSGRRKFDDRSLLALKFVLLAQTAGFTISEIRQLQNAVGENPGRDGSWVGMAEEKRKELHVRIEELQQMDRVLQELLSCGCSSLNDCIEAGLNNSGLESRRD